MIHHVRNHRPEDPAPELRDQAALLLDMVDGCHEFWNDLLVRSFCSRVYMVHGLSAPVRRVPGIIPCLL